METNADRVMGELRRVVGDAEALLAEGGDRLGDARDAIASRLRDARDRLELLEREALFHARHAARQVDRYAHDHPWQVAGIGVALATAVVLAAWLALDSRRD
jgi:ElaB/YqjD/DUF883 family membrane-anchored ribosome-binding protein